MIKKFFYSIGLAVSSFVLTLSAHAAADTDIIATIASSSSLWSDNKANLLAFIVVLATAVFVLSMSKGLLIMAIKWIKRGFFGGKK